MFSFTGIVISRYELYVMGLIMCFHLMLLMMAERRERGKNEQINSDVIESDEREHQRPNS
jgi:hypothetical protein